MDSKVIHTLSSSLLVLLFYNPGPKDKAIYYSHEGARTADSLEEWANEKIKANKGFLV